MCNCVVAYLLLLMGLFGIAGMFWKAVRPYPWHASNSSKARQHSKWQTTWHVLHSGGTQQTMLLLPLLIYWAPLRKAGRPRRRRGRPECLACSESALQTPDCSEPALWHALYKYDSSVLSQFCSVVHFMVLCNVLCWHCFGLAAVIILGWVRLATRYSLMKILERQSSVAKTTTTFVICVIIVKELSYHLCTDCTSWLRNVHLVERIWS